MNTTTLAQSTEITPGLGNPETLTDSEMPISCSISHIRFDLHPSQVGILTLDRVGSAANIFDRATLEQLDAHLVRIEHSPGLKGLVITSAKNSIFIAGADLHSLSQASKEEVLHLIELGQEVMNRVARIAESIPVVAAIHGACVGGGYELCLACSYRIASNDRSTRIGLPETQLGILPAWGGSTRLPRLIGMEKALDVILGGKTLVAVAAMKLGMVDELVSRERLLDFAIQQIVARGHGLKSRKLSFRKRLMGMPGLSDVMCYGARRQVVQKTRGHYPAVLKALDLVRQGIKGGVDRSLRLEREAVVQLLESDECRNLVGVFFLQERAKKFSLATGVDAKVAPLARAMVLGAGVMGAGIAQWLSSRGVRTLLRDLNVECVGRGMATIARLYSEGAKRKTFSAVEARAGMDRIDPVVGETPLHGVELVIEAAVEKMAVKKAIFRRLAEQTGPETVLATNTSALSIGELADATSAPERVIGLHFFNPVHRMQLVEVVIGPKTDPGHVQRAVQWVQQIGKLPVVVKDSPGFVVNRILMPYLLEAVRLFESGASIEDLDACMLDFGMPMGPMRLLDEVGVDVAQHVAETLSQSLPAGVPIPSVLSKMIEAGWLGKKAGKGFYLHENRGDVARMHEDVLACRTGSGAGAMNRMALQERLVMAMVNESARCLEEGIVADAADIDFAMIMGTGFAPFRGGPLRYADALGISNVVRMLEGMAGSDTPQFAPSELLRTLMSSGAGFYPRKGNTL